MSSRSDPTAPSKPRNPDADLIRLDPKSERGQAAVQAAPSHAGILALLERGAAVPTYADQPLFRPFRQPGWSR
jgi:hypothetical protein